jgi:hypothetical protein
MLSTIQYRCAQLVQPGEGQLHLRLHARRPDQAAPGRPLARVVKQHSLAYTRLTVHHQRPALTRPHSIDELLQQAAFGAPVC